MGDGFHAGSAAGYLRSAPPGPPSPGLVDARSIARRSTMAPGSPSPKRWGYLRGDKECRELRIRLLASMRGMSSLVLRVRSFAMGLYPCQAPGTSQPQLVIPWSAMVLRAGDGTARNVERYNAQLSTRQNVVSCLRPETLRRTHRFGLIGDLELKGNSERQPFFS